MQETEQAQNNTGSGKKADRTIGTMFSNQDLKRLIAPLIVEQILAVTVGMVDTIMVSSVGEAATSGVSLVDMINNLIINIFAAVCTGGAVVASQYLGQKNKKRACEAANQLIIIAGLISVLIMLIAIVFRRGLLTLIYHGVAPDVMQNAIVYLIISALSYPFIAVYNACAALFRSMGNSKISMRAALVMNILNCIGDYVLIFIIPLGVAGAAIASLLSRMTACILLFVWLRNPKLEIHIGGQPVSFNTGMIMRILNIGIPGGVENSIFQLGRVLVVSIIAVFGTTQIAANAVANNLDGLGVLPGQAMNLAMITVVGQCVGARDFGQAEFYAKKMMRLTYVINGLCCAVVILTMPLTLRLYGGLSHETLALAFMLVLIHDGCGILLWPAAFTLTNVLRAANDVRYPMCVSILSMLIFRIGLSYIVGVHMGMGAIGVWIAMVIDWIVRSVCFYLRYRSGKWQTFYHAD